MQHPSVSGGVTECIHALALHLKSGFGGIQRECAYLQNGKL